jgi:ABC-type amino acid transport substrate-binding protein
MRQWIGSPFSFGVIIGERTFLSVGEGPRPLNNYARLMAGRLKRLRLANSPAGGKNDRANSFDGREELVLVGRRALLWALPLVVGAAFTYPGSAQQKLIVGAYPANPPWAKNEKGQFEGFEVDLINEIGKRMGADVDSSDIGFQALFRF